MIFAELRYAARQLRKAPGFTLLALATLALGVGASTAVFTVVDSVVLKPLSYGDSGRLVVAWERVRYLGVSNAYVGPNPRHAEFWRKRATAFASLALARNGATGLAVGSEHPRLTGVLIATPNLLEILRVTPALGRSFRADEAVKGRDKVAILTEPLRQKLFGADRNVIGKMVRLSDQPLQVIGVLPASFRFPDASTLSSFQRAQHGNAVEPAILVPAVIDFNNFGWNSDYGNWVAIGRLKPGATVGEAEAQLNVIQSAIVGEMPAAERDKEPNSLLAYVQPMQEAVVGDSRQSLWLLMAAVIGLMSIACVNLASAQLGRAVAREREAAVRAALGASRWQLIWSSLAESLMLAALGGVAGVALAFGGLQLFRSYAPINLPRMGEIEPNSFVVLFSLVLIAGSGILFGLLPALKFLRADPQLSLHNSGSRTQGSRGNTQVRRWLIGLQVFGCTALLLVTGLFTKSLLHLLNSDKGFDTQRTVVAEVELQGKNYAKDATRSSFDDGLLEKLRAIPGVESAALMSAMPLEGETWIDGINRSDRPTEHPPLANLRWVSPGYFETIRERLVAGRYLEERDRGSNVVVISEAAAKAAWSGENVIGHQMRHHGKNYTVVGVVADARTNSLKLPPVNMVYLHYADNPPYPTFFLARGPRSATELGAAVRQAIWTQSPDVTIARIKTLDAQVSDSLAPERFQTTVLVAFGSAALLLAMLGIYGVLSYSVAGRRREIGVRMALGASRESIYSLTVSEATMPVLAGLAGGWVANLLAGRFIAALLYGVRPMDGTVSALVVTLFLTAALAAAFLPARRAASVDPMQALRAE